MPVWSETYLPCMPLRNTFTFRPEPNVVEFAPDVGVPYRRRRYTGRREIYEGELLMTVTQQKYMEDFYNIECADGTLSFKMKDWKDDRKWAEFTFINPPSYTRTTGGSFRVSLQLRKVSS